MRNHSYIFAILMSALLISAACGQQDKNRLKELTQRFEAFNYYGVIELADNMLKHRPEYTNAELVEIFRMRAIAHYSILDENSAARGFKDLLKLNADYELDSVDTSPKIVAFFRQVKTNFIKDMAKEESLIKKDSAEIKKIALPEKKSVVYYKPDYWVNARSLLIPGWGQLSLNQNTKNWLYSSAGLVSFGTMIYFIFDCNKKENSYLNEVDRSKIQAKYDSYNTSYKVRNLALCTFAALWIYSQIDLLFLNPPSLKAIEGDEINAQAGTLPHSIYSLSLSFRL